MITCPDDVTVAVSSGESTAAVFWPNPTATDNSGQVTVTTDFSPGIYPIGQQTVVGTATDPSGNQVMCTFQFFVIGK